jgi:hypothetical protein
MTNYMYEIGTGYQNLRKHLASQHAAAYDSAILENNWNYRLSSEVKSGRSKDNSKHSIPPFTQASFIDHLIRFVVADDQVSTAFSITNLCPHLYLVDSCRRAS